MLPPNNAGSLGAPSFNFRAYWQSSCSLLAAVFACTIGCFAVPAAGQTITDGDTLKLNGMTYRLWGIDAPETKQDYPDGWPAGRMATTRLLALIQGKTVVCERKDTDRYGRTVAICRASGEDLGAIKGSVAEDAGPLLLGMSFLGRFPSWSVDNGRNVLILK